MNRIFGRAVLIVFFLASLMVRGSAVYASTQLDLIPPEGELKRGDEVQFTITVDTGGSAVSSLQVGIEYDSAVLQYLNTTPGDTYQTITATPLDANRILITASNPVAGTINGNLAYVEFKIIADEPGETELCTLFLPETPTPNPQATAGPTNPPPSALPKTGEAGSGPTMAIVGTILLVVAGGFFFAGQNLFFPRRKK